ncbi:MAG: KpsF/GutQ family sugar-phosphate isomerase [Elusimicrobiaceae bacterium]|nr:KpsF/GutQ family sugar-phosphate isomerase [Elusimicrobiaceae bacterium]
MTGSERRDQILRIARRVMEIEGQAVLSLSKRLDESFVKAAELILECHGRAAVIGIGKSGLIARKIAATLASTGTPAVFVHPVECLHGDLGMLAKGDVIIVLSYSGETSEVVELVPALKELGLKTIAVTGNRASSLARLADIAIAATVKREACPINSAPTASTTAMLAVGDALAITLMKLKNFGKTDFARLHPGGSLGRILTLKVADLIKNGLPNPVIRDNETVRAALLVMTQARTGAVMAVDAKGRLSGFFTDGDLRRWLQKEQDLLEKPLNAVMTHNPVTVTPATMAADAAEILRSKGDNIPVVDGRCRPLALLDERDVLAVIPMKDNDA